MTKLTIFIPAFLLLSCASAKEPKVSEEAQRNFWHAAAEYNATYAPFKAAEASLAKTKAAAEKECGEKHTLQSDGPLLKCVLKSPAPAPEPTKTK